jgi:hypothetical protein
MQRALFIAERLGLDVGPLRQQAAVVTDAPDDGVAIDIITEVERRLTKAGRYVGTDYVTGKWYVYARPHVAGEPAPDVTVR